jgi:hypothetical protein
MARARAGVEQWRRFCQTKPIRSRSEGLGHGPIKANQGGTRQYKAEKNARALRSGFINDAYE